MPSLYTRLIGGLLALTGLVLTLMSFPLAAHVGPSGRAEFVSRVEGKGPVVIRPDVLNRVDAPVTIEAVTEDGAPVSVRAGRPSQADAVLGTGTLRTVTAVDPSGWSLRTGSDGSGSPATAGRAELWDEVADGRGRASVELSQADAPQTVVVDPGDRPVELRLAWTDHGWWWKALAGVVIGLALLALGLFMMIRGLFRRPGRRPAVTHDHREQRGGPGAHAATADHPEETR